MIAKKRIRKSGINSLRTYYGSFLTYLGSPEEVRIYNAFKKAVGKNKTVKEEILNFMKRYSVKNKTLSFTKQLNLSKDIKAGKGDLSNARHN